MAQVHFIFNCQCDKTDLKQYKLLKSILPENYPYRVCAYQKLENGFHATLRLPIKTAPEATEWKKQFEEISKTTFRLARTFPNVGEKVLAKFDLRCQHNVRGARCEKDGAPSSSKNTNCPATMSITVWRSKLKATKRPKDGHLLYFPTIVNLRFTHNHPINAADALRFRDVPDSIRKKFLEMFEAGHSPITALQVHKFDIQVENEKDVVSASADRALVPDISWCYRLFYSIGKKMKGYDNTTMLKDLEKQVEQFNSKSETPIIKLDLTLGQEFALAICTPLMKRVLQQVRQSGEVVFVDTSGNVERRKVKVFLLMTHNCCGGLPVGCLITGSESENVISTALELYKSLVPENAFNGRGDIGPMIFMTDDCDAERAALQKVFPEAKLILCVFRILQAAWRWLWLPKNKIAEDDRQSLFQTIKGMAYAASPDMLDAKYQAILHDEWLVGYQSFLAYVEKVYGRRELWPVCLTEDLLTCGHSTNTIYEAAVRVAKDKMPMQTINFSAVHLVHVVVTRMEGYYERCIMDVANGRLDSLLRSRYFPADKNGINLDNIENDAHNFSGYKVPSETKEDTFYHLDIKMGLCTCCVGRNGGPCKHQGAVVRQFKVGNLNIVPVRSPELRSQLFTIATGRNDVPLHFFDSSKEVGICTSAASDPDDSSHEEDDISFVTGDDVRHEESPDLQSSTGPFIVGSELVIGAHCNSSEVSAAKKELTSCYSLLMTKLENDPKTFLPAVTTFLTNLKKLPTDSALICALKTFGKYSELSNFGNKKRKFSG